MASLGISEISDFLLMSKKSVSDFGVTLGIMLLPIYDREALPTPDLDLHFVIASNFPN